MRTEMTPPVSFSPHTNHELPSEVGSVATLHPSDMTTIAYALWRGVVGTASGLAAAVFPSVATIEPVLRVVALLVGGVLVPAVTGYSIWLSVKLKKQRLKNGIPSSDSAEI